MQEAVIREVRKETGLTFDAHFAGYFDEIIPGHQIHAVVPVFAGPGSGDMDPQASKVSEIRWCSLFYNRARLSRARPCRRLVCQVRHDVRHEINHLVEQIVADPQRRIGGLVQNRRIAPSSR